MPHLTKYGTRTFIPIFLGVIFLISAESCSNNNIDEPEALSALSSGFADPPASSRPGAFWCWLNGDVTDESITHDLEEMKAKGMSRAEIWDVAAVNNPGLEYGVGPEFLGDESVQHIKHALSEGKRLGIKIGMVGSSGWNAGGTWVKPDWASKALFLSEFNISGPQKYSGSLPLPEVPEHCPSGEDGLPVFFKDVAVLAIPASKEKLIGSFDDIIILTEKFDGELLHWDVPAGDWTVLRFINSNTGQTLIVPSPKSRGLFIDFLDPEATKRHLGHILDRLGITVENAKESGFSYIEFDSMELDPATPWTDKMPEIFNSHHGLDIVPYLPVFAGWTIPGGNEEFMYKFKKTISDQLILSHYTTGRDFLAKYGMELVAEAGGPGPPIWETCPVDALKALGNVSIPRGEFWIRHRNMFLIKEVASASHIYGLGAVDAESFTTWRRWKDAPHDLKKYVDRAFCEGLNTITIHTFANTRPEHGLPGRTYHAGIDINPGTTWWEKARPFMDYLSRCSFMLKQGLFVADVAYYYGDKAPNFFPEFHDVPSKPGLEGLSPGYDFDVVNTDVILNRMDVEEGRIVLPDGMSYSLLVIPDREDVPEIVIEKIKKMTGKGAKILIQKSELAKSLNSGFLTGMTIDEALDELNVPKDFISESGEIDFIHRNKGGIDIYFLRNKTANKISETCSFRSPGKMAEIWDPVEGKIYSVKNQNQSRKGNILNIQLAPYESCFVIFHNNRKTGFELQDGSARKSEGYKVTQEVSGPWEINFPKNWGGPEESVLENLISWTEHPEAGIKYFSGTASYYKTIKVSEEDLTSDNKLGIDLGDVRDLAEVYVNGVSAGILWTKPFIAEIGQYMKAGNNEIRIDITNMWVNRLTGDMDLPAEERFCKTNHPFVIKDNWAGGGDETYHLQDAGLLGPVSLVYLKQ